MIQSIADLIAGLPARKVKLPEEYYDTRATAARDMAFTVSVIHQLDEIQKVIDSLEANIKAGGSFKTWKKDIQESGEMNGLPAHRKELVFRNHAKTAYAHGKCKQFADNAKLRPYLMYSAVGDSRTRPSHARLDGVIRPVGDEFWKTNSIPNGHLCRCDMLSLTKEQAKKYGGVTENPPDGFDQGWGYSPCENRTKGEEQSITRKAETYHPRLRGFFDGLLAGLAAVRAMFGQ